MFDTNQATQGEKMPLHWAQQTCDRRRKDDFQTDTKVSGAQLHPKLLLPPGGEVRAGALYNAAHSPLTHLRTNKDSKTWNVEQKDSSAQS